MTNYDLSGLNASSTTTILNLFDSVNAGTNYAFGTILLIAVFIGYYVMFKKEEKMIDLMTSTFITTIIATLFLFIGWITWTIYIVMLMLFVTFFILYFFTT